MGFLSGRMSFDRFWVDSPVVEALGTEHLEVLENYAIGKIEVVSPDEPNVGYLGGDHLFDLKFEWEKNVVNDALHFGIRLDVDTIPAALRKAWLQIELGMMLADSPTGKLNKTQRQEAKDAVEARCQEELKTGKYRKMSQSSALWDTRESKLYLAGGEHCCELMQRSFEMTLDRVTAGKVARRWATEAKQLDALERISPSLFHVEDGVGDVSWANYQSGSLDYLGNEFLLWLWWHFETNSDTIRVSDDSEVTYMLNRSLSLECPLGESGKDSFTHESPIKLPEAIQAIRSGKLPRKSGIILIRHGLQYEFVLQAETFAVGSARVQTEENSDENTLDDRIDHIRHLGETLDLLFLTFCELRISDQWTETLGQIRQWINADRPGMHRVAA